MFNILSRSLHIATRTEQDVGHWSNPDKWRQAQNSRRRRMARAEMHRDVPDRRWLEETRF